MLKPPQIKKNLINKGENNQIFDSFFSCNQNKKIILEEKSKLSYFSYGHGSDIDIKFELKGEYSELDVYCIFASCDENKSKINIDTKLNANFCKVNIYIVSFLANNGIVDVKANIDIGKNIKGVSGHLLEENILLGEKISVKTLPILNVSSNDVSASHGAKIQKIDNEKLFYMMSKGLSLHETKKLIVKGYFDNILGLSNLDLEKKNKIFETFLEYIKL
ncbi:SufD family Fe-S cluster assembly protein [Candidatus Gracilibacteria bacterium]|nr:SufD family Fe-S cluster assembly protein [Candidatus Gracilibacteria bacterium]